MRKYYFLIANILLLLLSVIGFSDNLFTNVTQKSNSDPKFIIHGLFCFAWFIILIIQTNFIRSGNYKAHMKLGISGVVAAVGVTLTILYIFVVVYKGWDAMFFIVKANRFFLPTYALFVWLGYKNRETAIKHKRYMYIGTLFMLAPILDRAANHFPMSADIFVALVWNMFFLTLFIYDWITLRRIHPISYLSFIWFYVVWIIAIFT